MNKDAFLAGYMAKEAACGYSHKKKKKKKAQKEAKKKMSKSDKKVKKVMGEYKRGELRSGSKTGPKVTSRDQAIAIALSEAGKSKK
jgi:hypothetical protein